MKKKFMVVALMAMMCLLFPVAVNAQSNATLNTASNYTFGTTQSGTIGEEQKGYYYKFTLDQSGTVNINFNANMYRAGLIIYNEKAEQIWSANPYWNDVSELIVENYSVELVQGTYYLGVENEYYLGDFDVTMTFNAAGESFAESTSVNNNTMANANAITLENGSYKGQLAVNDGVDYYRFELASSGRLDMAVTANISYMKMYILNAAGEEVASKSLSWNDASKQISENDSWELTKGTYYIIPDSVKLI